MFIQAQIVSWVTQRDGKNRVGVLDSRVSGGRVYLLNANRIRNPKACGIYTQFDFFDVLGSRRESPSVVIASVSMAQLNTAINTPFPTKFVNLPFYRNDNPSKSTEDYMVPYTSISYIDNYNPDPIQSWVIYYQNEFKRVERLCAYSMNQIATLGGTPYPASSITWDSIVISFDDNVITFDAI